MAWARPSLHRQGHCERNATAKIALPQWGLWVAPNTLPPYSSALWHPTSARGGLGACDVPGGRARESAHGGRRGALRLRHPRPRRARRESTHCTHPTRTGLRERASHLAPTKKTERRLQRRQRGGRCCLDRAVGTNSWMLLLKRACSLRAWGSPCPLAVLYIVFAWCFSSLS